MKTVRNICTAALIGLGMNVIAQTAPPAPPAPPATVYEDATTTVTTNSSNVSVITQNGNYGSGGSTSYSVSNSNDEYRVKSRYPGNRYAAIKEFLVAEMGTKNMQSSGKDMVWSLEGDEDTVYEIALSEKRLKIELDKTIAAPDMIAKFTDMGNILRTLVSGGSERQEIQRLERDADRARRDAARMQREAARLREVSVRDAARLEREALRLSNEAERLGLNSKRGGGIDSYVRNLLELPSTKIAASDVNSSIWQWPEVQEALINTLNAEGLLKGEETIVFVKEDAGAYANGTRLSTTQWSKVNSVFRKYVMQDVTEVSFYKKGNHIVIVDGFTAVEKIVMWLTRNDYIASSRRSVKMMLNGSSVIVDNVALPSSDVKKINSYLLTEGVITAPGKSLVINETGMSLGYSYDKSTLGTWVGKD
ncbi:hypothetical protein MED134_14607 [Dokdonia sp. MED134]|uniref:hypothetical protein n=1 Tax=Dokdonia sp. MED134 TaxID=313590 RepID=UPI000068A817|nr:hypothetical protein [Dokdonia sp. MED134]EAQ37668.1 hypothetical protein MED134_14607 [Dokdonia sp. MED134]